MVANQDAGIGARVVIGAAAALNSGQGVEAHNVSDAYAALNGSDGILAANARNAYSVANTGAGSAAERSKLRRFVGYEARPEEGLLCEGNSESVG